MRDPDVPVHGLGRMEEHRRGARGDHGRGDFLRDEARLPHAGHNDLPGTGVDEADCLFIRGADALAQPCQGAAFELHYPVNLSQDIHTFSATCQI